ncbi:MAG: iron ABC transporter permease [Treponema sp.]|nr:iron ABC transporter permease [Treponema sp.]
MVTRSKINKFFIEDSLSLSFTWLAVFIIISICIVLPLIFVLLTPGTEDFARVLHSKIWHKAMLNTFLECICSTSLSVIIGYVYAYAIVYGKIPFSKFFSVIPLIHLITPPFVGGLSFILLLGRQGFITKTLLGLDVSLYGFPGLLIAQSLCFFPLAYMICFQVLKGINHSLEQAAYALGARGSKIFFTITLPLSLQGLLASFLFIAVSVMSDFGNPMIVAGRFKVLAVEIYTQLTGWINGGTSAALGLCLVIPSGIIFFIQNKITKKSMLRTATIGSRGLNLPQRENRLITRIFLTIFCAFISLCILAQFLSIIAGSFQKLWGINTSFTLKHVKNLFGCTKELKNSLLFALEGAFAGTIMATIASYLVYRTKSPFKRYIDIVSQLPAAIPGSLFGLAFSIMAAKFNFHNSAVLIVIAIAVGFMPFSYRMIAASFAQIKTNLDDGALSLGANKLEILRDILLPLSKGSIFDSFIYDFVRGVGTMSAVIFLVSFNTPLTSIKILNLAEEGFWGDAAALALLLTIITFAVIGIGKAFIALMEKKVK